MQRKVIQIANSTQLISLPRKWCKELEIMKGDPLEVTEDGRRIIVSAEKSVQHKKIEVDVSEMDSDLLVYTLRTLYKNGYDEIKLIYNTDKIENIPRNSYDSPFDVIENETRNLSGLEIFDQNVNFCIIKSISAETMKEFDTMLKRIFSLSSSTMNDLLEGYTKDNKALIKTIQGKHDSISKFTSYCQRLLNKVSHNEKKTEIHYQILEVIDIIIDLIKHSADALLQNNISKSKKGLDVYKKIIETFDMFLKLYYTFDNKTISAIIRNKFKIKPMTQQYFKDCNKEELGYLTNMARVFENILRLMRLRLALEY